MADVKSTILKFVVKASGNLPETMSRFHPKGQIVLNRTAWMGREPRSCGVTRAKGRPFSPGDGKPIIFDVEVSYRPKGCITYVGDTRYDGWTAMLLDRAKDGTLLDGHGNPLASGQAPVFLPFEVFGDAEFNDIDFGDFQGEVEVEGIRRIDFKETITEMQQSGYFAGSTYSTFMTPRNHRPYSQIILTHSPFGIGSDHFGARVVNIDISTPHLEQVIIDQIKDIVGGVMEGRYSLKNFSGRDAVFLDISSILVDCTPNEEGKQSRFNCLFEYVPATFMEDIAKWLMANYEVDVAIVEGENHGLLLRQINQEKWV
jgi:hypothetical protein